MPSKKIATFAVNNFKQKINSSARILQKDILDLLDFFIEYFSYLRKCFSIK